jgi:hypothetical protein
MEILKLISHVGGVTEKGAQENIWSHVEGLRNGLEKM